MRIEARTNAEAIEFVKLQVIECDEVEVRSDRTFVAANGTPVDVYSGGCRGKAPTVEYEFTYRAAGASEDRYGPGVSDLIDAGQWLLLLFWYERVVSAGIDAFAGPTLPEVSAGEDFLVQVESGRGCAVEATKQLAAAPDPSDALWTDQGRRMLGAHPETFQDEFIRLKGGQFEQVAAMVQDRYQQAADQGLLG